MRRIVFIQILLFAASGGAATIDLGKWQYSAEVSIEDGRSEYCALMLSQEVYNAARVDLADIRLIDADGRQIPYVLDRPEDSTATIRYTPAMLNRSTDAAGNALVTLDFGGQTVKNCIEVETSGDNFRRVVKVEGSNDNVRFFTIVERAYVFAVSDRSNHRFSRIDLPSNDYRYLRITVSPMATEETRLVINEVRAFKIEGKTAKRQVVEMIQTEHTEDEKAGSSAYVYDLKFCRLPIVEIELDVKDASFYRCVTLQGRDAATRKVKIDSEDNRERFADVNVPWNIVATETIYRYADSAGEKRERIILPVGAGGSYRYLKVVVSNYDDQPITIRSASAKMIPHRIVFAAPAARTARIYVGCESAVHPHYDLARRLSRPADVKAALAKLGSLTDNPLYGKAQAELPWSERHKVLLLVTLSVVVLVIGAFMLKSLKSIQNSDGNPGAKQNDS
jgi:hypothetical protein